MDELTRLLGAPPHTFNYDVGTIRYINLTTLDPKNPFLIPPHGAPEGTVGLQACEALAGPGHTSYGRANTLDAIATWVIPLLVLLGNINYASFSKQPYWNQVTIALHLFGNPIQAMWALLTKLDVKRRIEARCREEFKTAGFNGEDVLWIYSTILYALDDFSFSANFESHLDMLMRVAKSGTPEDKEACRKAAVELNVSRVNNTRRALFAILGYLAAITANILRAIFADSIQIHISHTVALRELNFWLLCAILLSAKVGGLPSEWNSLGVLMDLQARLDQCRFELKRLDPWTGGNYTWRPDKNVSHTFSRKPGNSQAVSRNRDYRFLVLGLLAFLSVTMAMTMSLAISYETPTKGIGIRSIVELCYWAWWCVNAIATYFFDKSSVAGSRKYWLCNVAKDSVGALFMLLFLFSAWSGWWNSCFHWSMALDTSIGRNNAYVDLVNMKTQIHQLIRGALPRFVAVGVASQLIFAVLMIWYCQGTLQPPNMKDTELESLYGDIVNIPRSSSPEIEMVPLISQQENPA